MTARLAAAASIGANVAATTAGTRATRVPTRAAASTPRLAPKQRRSRPHRGAPPQPRSLVRRNVASRGSANDEGTDADDKDPSGKDERSSIRAPGSTRPPERGTGIAREFDMIVDFDAEERSETDDDGNAFFSKSGVDTGDGGYRCRWTVTGRTAKDGTWEYRATHWEKADWSGYKELGAEKSGFDDASGDTWWETWRQVYRRENRDASGGDGSSGTSVGPALIERSADKWARDKHKKEWQEKWWERYSDAGLVERGVEKSGRQGVQAWWEKWGEQRDVSDGGGDVIKWTDKWAENGAGTRWGDKWEERFGADGSGKKVGETWRVNAGGERWSRTWGESVGSDGEIRTYGQSTSGEQWDTTEQGNSSRDNSSRWEDAKEAAEYGWEQAVADSTRMLAIETPPREK